MLIFPNPNSELFSLAARKEPCVFYITNFSVLEAMDEEESDDETLISDIGENKGKSGIWSTLTSLVGTKQLTDADVEPVISKMRDHLIGKNVASEVADKLCQSVASKLEGKVLGKSTLFFFFIQRNKTLAMCVSCRTFLPSQFYIFDRKNILISPGHSFLCRTWILQMVIFFRLSSCLGKSRQDLSRTNTFLARFLNCM